MSDAREIPAVLEAATQAAASGDLAAAEAHLLEVVRLQEAGAGRLHPDLASTLNNLAVVCEMAGKPAQAEQFYRRAHAIASASLDPHDPRVATSLNNLKEFCQARGIAMDVAPAVGAQSAAARAPAQRAPAAVPAHLADRGLPKVAPAPARQGPLSRAGVVAALVAVALLAALVAFWSWERNDGPGAAEPAPAAVAATPAPPAPVATAPAVEPTPAPPAAPVVDAPARTAAARPSARRASSTRVLDANLCRTLSTEGAEWTCAAPSSPAAPGRLYFYTRISANEDVLVRHRWYRADRLVQDVGLTVRANPGAGYRTFSRQTVNALAGGQWRIEVSTPDGALLHEERFAVR